MKKLDIIATIKDGISLGMVNFFSLVLTFILYFVTIWIPYLNVGTTIAICSLPAELAKGAVINPLFIFDGKYRKHMGEFFILVALMGGAIIIGLIFGIIPALVLAVAWSFATVLFIDKDLSALDALRQSDKITYGNKWRIFGTLFLIGFCLQVIVIIIRVIFGIGHVSWLIAVGAIIAAAVNICAMPVLQGVEASIYKQLSSGEFLGTASPAPAPAAPASPAPEVPASPATPVSEA